jgi:hypothetical protein
MNREKQRDVTRVAGSKYYKGRCIHHGEVFHFVVWDGVRNYRDLPPGVIRSRIAARTCCYQTGQ